MLDPLEQELRNDWADAAYDVANETGEGPDTVFANKDYFDDFAGDWLNSRGLTQEENVKKMIDAVAKTL